MSYVDDTYLMVTSESYEHNCSLLSKYFKQVMAWADSQQVRFEPSKYEVMHLRHRDDRGPAFDKVPELVEGITCKPTMKILGVTLDPKLTWEVHVREVGLAPYH